MDSESIYMLEGVKHFAVENNTEGGRSHNHYNMSNNPAECYLLTEHGFNLVISYVASFNTINKIRIVIFASFHVGKYQLDEQ